MRLLRSSHRTSVVLPFLAACAISPTIDANDSSTIDATPWATDTTSATDVLEPRAELCPSHSTETRSDGTTILLCHALYDDYPRLHLPPNEQDGGDLIVFGGFDRGAENFHGLERVIPVRSNGGDVPTWLQIEAQSGNARYGSRIYRARVRDGAIQSIEAYAAIDEGLFLEALAGMKLEGLASARLGPSDSCVAYDWENPSLPVRIELGAPEGSMLTGRVVNLDTHVMSASGECLPALSNAGGSNPFTDDTLTIRRVVSMHGFFDDVFTVDFEGMSGSNMGGGLYVSPADLLANAPRMFTDATNRIHGNPACGISLALAPASGGGEQCAK